MIRSSPLSRFTVEVNTSFIARSSRRIATPGPAQSTVITLTDMNCTWQQWCAMCQNDARRRSKALASVKFRPMPIEEQLGLLPFKLGDLSGFQVMQVSPNGSIILADNQTDNNERQPFVIVSLERGGPPEAADRGLFARNLLATAPVRDLTMQSADSMRISGAPGHEIRASGKGPAGDPVSVVQWLRFGGGAFLRVVGVSPAEKWDQSFGRFRAVRDGIAMR